MLIKTRRAISVSYHCTNTFSTTGYYTLDTISRKSTAFSHLGTHLRGELNMTIGNLISQHRYLSNAAPFGRKEYICL
jgi:hypothetical protein